jgi:hypothetical protein
MENQSNQPEAQHPPSQGLRLDTIAEDVQHIIAAELVILSPPSILAMAQSSRTLRQIALPLVYQDVVLHREDEAYEALVTLFRGGGEGSIAHHVRHLMVKDELPTEDLIMILDKISEFGVLRKLRLVVTNGKLNRVRDADVDSWETVAHMPPSVLDKLHNTWPDLELSVRVLGRRLAKNSGHRQMDEKLLSSSLLRSLTYDIIYPGYQADHSAIEWAKLTRAISVGGGLRVLRIRIQYGGEEPESDLQLELPQDSHLPALKELTLHGAHGFNWTDEHCRRLASSVDMSTLHTLNFARGMPTPFLKAFTGRLPDLKTLRFEIGRNANAEITADFIESVKGLELLDIDGPISVMDTLWPAIVQHRATLKSLCLRQNMAIGRLEEVVNSFPLMQRLGWNVLYEVNESTIVAMNETHLRNLGSSRLSRAYVTHESRET